MTLMDAAFHQLSLCLRSILRFDPLCRVCQPCLVIRITGERLSLSRYLNRTQLRRKRIRPFSALLLSKSLSDFRFQDALIAIDPFTVLLRPLHWSAILRHKRVLWTLFASSLPILISLCVVFLSFSTQLNRSLRHVGCACNVFLRTCLHKYCSNHIRSATFIKDSKFHTQFSFCLSFLARYMVASEVILSGRHGH